MIPENPNNSEIFANTKTSLTTIFEWMPVCSLIVDKHGIIQDINQKAVEFFRAATKEDFIFDKENISNMIVDSQHANELLRMICRSTKPTNHEILIRRFDKTIAGIDLHARLFPDDSKLILIQFYEKNTNHQIYIHEASQAFKREAQRLKPYLNKPGKNILEEVINSNASETIVPKKKALVIISDERMTHLTNLFPNFSNNELYLCGYLSLKMTIDEIAILTGKTPNCLRVSLH
ncbi:MAG: PAS domain-containing protein [Paludibacter sp.]